MDIAEALRIVIDNARRFAQELADDPDKEPQDEEREAELWTALAIVEDLAVNEYGDD